MAQNPTETYITCSKQLKLNRFNVKQTVVDLLTFPLIYLNFRLNISAFSVMKQTKKKLQRYKIIKFKIKINTP